VTFSNRYYVAVEAMNRIEVFEQCRMVECRPRTVLASSKFCIPRHQGPGPLQQANVGRQPD